MKLDLKLDWKWVGALLVLVLVLGVLYKLTVKKGPAETAQQPAEPGTQTAARGTATDVLQQEADENIAFFNIEDTDSKFVDVENQLIRGFEQAYDENNL